MPTTLTLTPTGQTLTVPTRWADVSLATYVALYAPAPDEARRPAELLCGLAAGALDNLAADDVHYLSTLLEFAADPGPVLELLPTPGLPEAGALPYGTLLLAQQRFQEEPERPWLASAAYLLALYRVTMLYGSAKPDKAVACESALLAAPVTESYPDAAFFLTSYRRSASGTSPTPTTSTSRTTTKAKPGPSGWRTALARCWASIWRPAAPC